MSKGKHKKGVSDYIAPPKPKQQRDRVLADYARYYHDVMLGYSRDAKAKAVGILGHASSMASLSIVAITLLINAPTTACNHDGLWWLALGSLGGILVLLSIVSYWAVAAYYEEKVRQLPEPQELRGKFDEQVPQAGSEAVEGELIDWYNRIACDHIRQAETTAELVLRCQRYLCLAICLLVVFAVSLVVNVYGTHCRNASGGRRTYYTESKDAGRTQACPPILSRDRDVTDP